MAETESDRKRFEAEGRKGAVKLKMPREGVCTFHDHVRGDMAVEWAGEQDTRHSALRRHGDVQPGERGR